MLSQERIVEIADILGSDEKRIRELLELTPEQAAEKLSSEGKTVKAEELIKFAECMDKLAGTNGELDEEGLEQVAGGIIRILPLGGPLPRIPLPWHRVW